MRYPVASRFVEDTDWRLDCPVALSVAVCVYPDAVIFVDDTFVMKPLAPCKYPEAVTLVADAFVVRSDALLRYPEASMLVPDALTREVWPPTVRYPVSV